ncbi:zinc finger and SCAN domain-containing protein 20-like [Lineus longissimus]|uniref:zinc finger and SCAN domain-containing protein 20-like n=1 Tax=Lineus longissimus TaxID=88925 RepID=UPI00315C548D
MAANLQRSPAWSRDERLALLRIWRDEDIEGQLQGNHRNSHVYSRIAELLKLEGYDRTTDQCRNKLKSMKGDWVKARNNLGRSGTSGRNGFGDEELLDEVLGTRPIHNPRHIVDTMFDRPGAEQHDGDGRDLVRIVSERS